MPRQTGTQAQPTEVDWPAFMQKHDMTFDAIPESWEQAPHFGNAMIGSMFYRKGDLLCLEVFRADVQDHRDDTHGWTAYSRPRFRIGYFELHTVGKLTGCTWRKSLWNAELTGTITTDAGRIDIRHFTHADDMTIVTELSLDAGEAGLRWVWKPYEARASRPGYPTDEASTAAYVERYGDAFADVLQPDLENPPGRLEQRGESFIWTQDLLAGGQYATAWQQVATDQANTLYVSIEHSYPDATAAELALKTIERCTALNREAWIQTHQQWWHAYYQRSFVKLPDAKLESLYWQTIYRYGCCSRGGRFYIDTSGLWFQGGPWAYSTHDWNTQAAHWGVYAANRLEQGAAIVEHLEAGRDELVAAVHPESWREDSAYLPLATAADMRGDRRGDMRYYDLVGCLPWLLHNVWLQYRFSMDEAILRDTLVPLLRRAVNLYRHIMTEGDDGSLHLSPTYSPETGVWRDANFDLALCKWGCFVLLKAAERLGLDDPLIPTWRDITERLVDFPQDQHGYMLGSDEPAHLGHRHLSHLLMIYPLYLVNVDQPDTADVLTRSYNAVRQNDGSDNNAISKLHAMLQTHAAPMACALGRAEDAYAGLKLLADDLSPVGLWGCNDNPCIESTLGAADIMQNMLIQSWSDVTSDEQGCIRIFPALPDAWQDVEYHDLRAEGAFLVSAKREAGRTVWAKVTSLAGEPCRVKWDTDEAIESVTSNVSGLEKIAPGVYDIGLNKGESVELRPVIVNTISNS